MQHALLRITSLSLLLAVAATPGSGASVDPAVRVPLRLHAPPPFFDRLQTDQGEVVVPRIAGFGLSSRPGEPMLPVRVLRVAIPAGAEPTLVILDSHSRRLSDLAVAPVPAVRVTDREPMARMLEGRAPAGHAGRSAGNGEASQGAGYADAFAGDRRLYGQDGEFPAQPLRLGRIGFLREQRFVEVIYTPILYNPVGRRARLVDRIDAEIRFETAAGGLNAGPWSPDPAFEETYRASLVNYEQGKRFRVPPGRAVSSPAGSADASSLTTLSPDGSALTTTAAGGGARCRIPVAVSGIYRVAASQLSAVVPELAAADPRGLMLLAEGVEVPISIRSSGGGDGEADGRLDAGDFIEFFGRSKSEPPTVVNVDFPTTFPDIYQANDFTDTQVYWLSAEDPALPRRRIAALDGTPVNAGLPLPADFAAAAVWDENNIYLPLEDADPFFSIPSLLAGSAQAQRDLLLALPGIAPVAATAEVTVRLRGGSSLTDDPDHRTRAWINSATSGAADFTWDGEVIKEQTFNVAQGLLTDPVAIHVSAPGITGLAVDRQYLDRVTIRYRRNFTAAGDRLDFIYPNQDARFRVSGFAGAAPTVYEVTRALPGGEADPVRVTGVSVSGAGSFTYTFDILRDPSPTAPATRSFVVLGPGGILSPAGMQRAADPLLTLPTNEADIIVIGARDSIDATPGGSLDLLLGHRLNTRGLTSRVVYVDQIYDEFGFGLRSTGAIRDFLAYAYDNWRGSSGTARPPSFALLVGDATPDYKNTMGRTDWVDQVPTAMMFQRNSILGYYSSDNDIACFRGADQIPDIHLGRISTRTAAAAAAVFDKIRRYEEAPPAGSWKGRMVLTAGDGKFTGETDGFEQIQDSLASSYFNRAPWSIPEPPLYFAQSPWNSSDAVGFRQALTDEFTAGAALVSYIGHGSFETWGLNTFFTTADASALRNGPLLPFAVNVNCLAGGFHFLLESGSLGEGLTNNPSGGAIATLAPSGLSSVFAGDAVAGSLFEPLFGPERERLLGEAVDRVRQELGGLGMVIDLQSYTFLGDPATLLATPAPAPPSGLAATAGNGEVTLSWTASPEPVAGYRLYRSARSAAGPYLPVDCTPDGTVRCIDRTVINATTYYYYAVAFDLEGFEGRASNFNGDCDAGPDCVVATPINDAPPAVPTGLASHDQGIGGVLQISWSANPERDIKSYTLRYGTVPGDYPFSVSVAAPGTSTLLAGLTDNLRYYITLSATNTSGLTSAPAGPISDVPHLIQGIAPPRAIGDLRVERSGADLVLTWSRPMLDIYERPTVVASYDVYRGSSPGFLPFAAAPLAHISDPAVTSFVDPGAALLSGDAYYLVTATDSNGFRSGAGGELPAGTGDLRLAVTGPDTVRLTWSAVATDVAGFPITIDHYQIHRASRPLARSGLGSTTLVVDNVRALSVDLTASGTPVYFSVIAVDARGNLSPF